ncbi:hypothetical protein HF521_011188 [Silurus meridionalis]|uniref:Uncharacterized protein n=1 Tax=Silurus meridionalis TaxID=175797 RepID=A0A8T0AF25_SILME|nr:hypothetical protein HF521_011188 [Silurus meridionalis]
MKSESSMDPPFIYTDEESSTGPSVTQKKRPDSPSPSRSSMMSDSSMDFPVYFKAGESSSGHRYFIFTLLKVSRFFSPEHLQNSCRKRVRIKHHCIRSYNNQLNSHMCACKYISPFIIYLQKVFILAKLLHPATKSSYWKQELGIEKRKNI